jgi:hypothetical protein
MAVRLVSSSTKVFPLRLRMPFRYGIATATEIPHLLWRGDFEIDGERQIGRAADHLPPKWFTKDPTTSFENDIADLRRAIDAARSYAQAAGAATSVFDLWKRVYDSPQPFSSVPLIHSFACSFIERAAIDAFCRGTGQTFADALRRNTLGIAPSPTGIPDQPLRSLIVRHTIGLSDPFTDADVLPGERLDDGLPQSLEACVAQYGLTHFKIKLCGCVARDVARLRGINRVAPAAVAFTLDGNENFADVEQFREFWREFRRDLSLSTLREKILFVEQPLRRDVALSEETSRALQAWTDRPPMIIDESDDRLDSSARALRGGYVGTSYKSCKGVFKGIANTSLMRAGDSVISAEDLTTIGPLSLLADLAVVAALGIPHVERNGHHYFRGLSMWPREVQQRVLAAHGDLYENVGGGGGFATLRIRGGRVDVGSVLDAPFGVASSVIEALDQAAG